MANRRSYATLDATGRLPATQLPLPAGLICQWVGKGIPAGWQLCDGTNGSPDLQPKGKPPVKQPVYIMKL